MADRFKPFFERLLAPVQWVGELVGPALERLSGALSTLVGPLVRLAAAAGSALAPLVAGLRSAARWVTTPLRWAGRWVAQGYRVVRAVLSDAWAALRRFGAELLGRAG